MRKLLNEITIGETFLFRSPAQLKRPAQGAPAGTTDGARKNRPGEDKVWRARCSTGEVPHYLRRKIDAGSERPPIRTIPGVGYQIGGNHFSR